MSDRNSRHIGGLNASPLELQDEDNYCAIYPPPLYSHLISESTSRRILDVR
jgi:hypothetical protein